jgi:hypothetical protein
MLTETIRSLHHGHADIQEWILKHVPLADSPVGYELFFRLADLNIDHGPVDPLALCASLPFPADEVLAALARFEQAGLLQPAGGDAPPRLRKPTAALGQLLLDYFTRLEHAFIPRETLRQRQLLAAVDDPARRQFIADLYDHFFDLGWLDAHNYGSMCFLMSTLVMRIAQGRGHDARVECLCLEIEHATGIFGVGVQGVAGPGQLDGHAVCIVDNCTLVDFGLGNVRKCYRRDFYWGLARDLAPQQAEFARMQLTSSELLRWKKAWVPAGAADELQASNAYANRLLAVYDACYG